MTKTLQLLDKDFKAAMVKIHQQAITNMFGTNAITEMQSPMEGPDSGAELTETRTQDDRATEITPSEQDGKQAEKKMSRASYLWSYNKRSNIHLIGLLGTEEKGEELKTI